MEIDLQHQIKEIRQVFVADWEYALQAVENLDVSAYEGNRRSIRGKTAINILAEYGLIAHKCASPPEGTKLAIVISPPFVRFCPSRDGLDGVFIEKYAEEKHGKCFLELTKKTLCGYTNIDSRIDGWEFFANMVSLGRENMKIALNKKYQI